MFKALKLKYKSWITKEILESIKRKRKLYKNLLKIILITQLSYKNTKSTEINFLNISRQDISSDTLPILRQDYDTNFLLKAYCENILENSYKNTSKIWKVINNNINKQKKESHFPHRLDVDQKSYTKPTDIVNKFNTHFSNIGKQTSSKKCNPLGFTDNLKNVSNSFFGLIRQKLKYLILSAVQIQTKPGVKIVYLLRSLKN